MMNSFTKTIVNGLSPRRIWFWLLVVILAYTLAGFFLAPWLLERYAVRKAADLGRSLTVGKVRINPYMLDILVENTEFRDTDGSLLASYDEYYWNFQLSSLINRAWTFREIRLLGLRLNAERFKLDQTNFGRLMDSFPEDESQGEVKEKGGLPRLIIHDLYLIDGRLRISDHLYAKDFEAELGPITIHVKQLSTLPDHSGRQEVSIVTEQGTTIAWDGSLKLAPLHSRGRVTIKGNGLSEAHRYLDLMQPVTTSGGGLEATFDYELGKSAEGPVELALENIEVEALDLALEGPADMGEIIRVPRVNLKGGSLQWPQRSLMVDSVLVTGSSLKAWLNADGSMNLMGLRPEGQNSQTDDDSGVDTPAPWQFELNKLELSDASINLQDRSLQPPVELSVVNASLKAAQISNQAGAEFPAELSFELSSGGVVQFNGAVKALPSFSGQGAIRVQALRLDVAQPYVDQFMRIKVDDGALSMDGTITSDQDEPAAYQGSVFISSLDIKDVLKNERLLGWELLDIDHLQFSLANRDLQVSEVEFNNPFGRVHIAEDLTTNIGDLIRQNPEEKPADTSPDAMAVTVGGIVINGASLDFSDFSLPLPFAASIRSLEGEISTLSSASSEPAKISLEGQVNEYGLARIEGSINAWAFAEHTDIHMTFRNLEMARLTPYTIQFAGHAIDAGKMDLDLDYSIASSQLQGGNKVVIRELTLGDKVDHPDAVSLPLGLAVALLTDSEGVIDIDLPVSGDLNDPEFSYGSIVAKAIFNLITKVVTAPFRLLGQLVGMDSEDFGTLEFTPGRADLSPPDQEKLVKLGEAMLQRPSLTLEVGGVYDDSLDRGALKELKLESLLEVRGKAEEAAGSGLSSAQLTRNATESLFVEAFPDVALESVQTEFMRGRNMDSEQPASLDTLAYVAELRRRLVDQQAVSDEELLALGAARADSVVAAVTTLQEGESLRVQRAAVVAVDAKERAAVPLELKVSIEENDQ